jgi:hopanoid biosynthesis associated protein HpnK
MAGRLIVNADDFGLCEGVNRAVKCAHTEGVLTSATIMVGMNAAKEAIEMAGEMPGLGVGVHLNLTEGTPISKDERVKVLLNANSRFGLSLGKLAVTSIVSKTIRKAVETEWAAQIQWLIAGGIKPTHLDSHKHVHTCPAIWPVVVSLAKRFGIGAIRWPFEPARVSGPDWPTPPKGGRTRARIVRTMAKINRKQNDIFIKNDMFLGTAHTGKIDVDFWRQVAKNPFDGVVEVMTHPGFAEGLNLTRTRLIEQRQVELEALCSEEVRKFLADANIELTHYGKL